MARLFKISGYYIDPNGDWSEDELKTELEQRFDLIDHHIKVESVDIGEFEDDSPLNRYDSPIEECEKYFSNTVLNNTQHLKSEELCLACAIHAKCVSGPCFETQCGMHLSRGGCVCTTINKGEVCPHYRPA